MYAAVVLLSIVGWIVLRRTEAVNNFVLLQQHEFEKACDAVHQRTKKPVGPPADSSGPDTESSPAKDECPI